MNTIRMQAPATVAGRAVDASGEPASRRLRISYHSPYLCSHEPDFLAGMDGSFSFDRVMPGAEFEITGCGTSGPITIRPGERRTGLVLRAEPPACLTIVVTDEAGASPAGTWEVSLTEEGGSETIIGVGGWSPRFSQAVGSNTFRFHVFGGNFQDYISDPIRLKPGELRFLHVRVKPK